MHNEFGSLWQDAAWRQDNMDDRTVPRRYSEKCRGGPMTERGIGRQHARQRPTTAIQLTRIGIDEVEAVRDAGPWRLARARTTYQARRGRHAARGLTMQTELLSSVACHRPNLSGPRRGSTPIGRAVEAWIALWTANLS